MILASDIFTAVRVQLDDDYSARYKEATDLVPALNAAINYLVTVFNAAFEQKKFAPENLRELVRVAIVPVTGTGNVKRANLTAEDLHIWTIFGVEPSPENADSTTTVEPGVDFESENKFADRLTLEEWNDRSGDPFSGGSIVSIPTVFRRAAYLGPGRYYGPDNDYILIRPSSVFTNDYIGVWYLTNPTKVTSGSTEVEFPQALFNLLVDKSLNYISRQHGSESKLGPVTEKDVLQVLALMTV